MVVKMENNHNPQLLYSWHAPVRAYKKTTTGILRFYIALSLLLSLIVFFFGEKILILPIWAVMFLYYVFTITPPHEIENRITKFGIETAGNTYRFDGLSHFYFIKKFDYDILVVVAQPPISTRLYLVVENAEDKNHLVKILSENLVYQENPNKNVTDKMSEWLTRLMPEY